MTNGGGCVIIVVYHEGDTKKVSEVKIMLVYEIYEKSAGDMVGPIWGREFDERWNCFLIDAMIKKAIESANTSGYAFEFKRECLNVRPHGTQVGYYDELEERGTIYCIYIHYYDERKFYI